MRALYRQVAGLLRQVNFEKIWPGFTVAPFALYDDQTVWLADGELPWDQRVLGSTAIWLDGVATAIGRVPDPQAEDPVLLTAGLVHELFHTYQFRTGETRFPQDLRLLHDPETVVDYQAKLAENRVLAAALRAEEGARAAAYTMRFESYRKHRYARLGAFSELEALSETAEGIAEFAGLSALRQLSPQRYADRLEEYCGYLETLSPLLFDTRRISYYSGALFCLAMDRAGLPFRHPLGSTQETLFALVSRDLPALPPEQTELDAGVEAQAADYFAEKRARFASFTAVSYTHLAQQE